MAMPKNVLKEAEAVREKVFERNDTRQPREGDVHGVAMKYGYSDQRQREEDEFDPYAEQGWGTMGLSSKGIRGEKDDPCNEKKNRQPSAIER
jgi:hypothetical protein